MKDILKVSSSNVISLMESVAAGLLIPMILGVTNFGYYRIYVLYSTYTTTLLSFGIIDGIVLKYGGQRYSSLNKDQFRSNTLIFIILEFIIALVIILGSCFINNNMYSFIFFAVGINTFFSNVYIYYQFIAKTTMDFGGYSLRNIIKIMLTLILIMFLWILYKMNFIYHMSYMIYIYCLLIIYIIMLLICVHHYDDITFGHNDSLIQGFKRIVYYSKIGIYLTVAYQISNLILIVDNQIISMFFKASVYGIYSFSYNIINAAILVLNAISTVLLPHLKQDTVVHMINVYHNIISIIMIVAYFSLIAYFPLCYLVHVIIPAYNSSLIYLKIFLPELGIICPITMVIFNYYSALNRSKFYFYISTVVLIISVIIDIIFYLVFKNPLQIAFGSLITIFIWYLISEYYLIKWYHVKWIKNLIYMLLVISIFMFDVYFINNLIIGMIIYFVMYIIISSFMFKNVFNKLIKSIVANVYNCIIH